MSNGVEASGTRRHVVVRREHNGRAFHTSKQLGGKTVNWTVHVPSCLISCYTIKQNVSIPGTARTTSGCSLLPNMPLTPVERHVVFLIPIGPPSSPRSLLSITPIRSGPSRRCPRHWSPRYSPWKASLCPSWTSSPPGVRPCRRPCRRRHSRGRGVRH